MRVRVATYNIHYGGRGREQLIAEVLTAMDVDAVVLPEASDAQVIDTIAKSTAMEFNIASGKKTSLALLSRVPIASWKVYNPPTIERPLLEATLDIGPGLSITLFGMHLQCHYLRMNERHRVFELKTYLSYIRSTNHKPHLLLGDFNAIAPGDPMNREELPLKERLMLWWERGRVYHDAIGTLLAQGYQDCFRSLHPGETGFTLPVGSPHVRLDYIFASPDLARCLVECIVVNSPAATLQGSDHYPVLAEFKV